MRLALRIVISPLTTQRFVESRRCKRYQLQLPVLFSWLDETHRQSAGFTRDIGTEGAFVFARSCPPLGAYVKIEIVLPLSRAAESCGRAVRLRCIGKVIRIENDLSWSQGGFAVMGDFANQDYSRLAEG